jgi:hypothetical protein
MATPFSTWDWLNDAVIYNKKFEIVPPTWIKENADILLLLFNSRGNDKDGIIEKFYTIYERNRGRYEGGLRGAS